MRALILMHGDWGPPGLLAEWLGARGIAFDVHRTYEDAPWPDPSGYDFVASLGSNRNPRDTDDPGGRRASSRCSRRAIAADVPVLGLCFGGQALAAALGGRVEPAPVPEVGWVEIETDVPELVPAGPWLTVALRALPAARRARPSWRATPRGRQAFRHGRHLGVQFHPESTPEIVLGWAQADAERLRALGHADGAALVAAPPQRRAAARAAAFALFDGFLET